MPRVFCALFLLLAAAGCAGGGEGSIETKELAKTVLQPRDLPDVFVQFDEGKLQLADRPRSNEGWKARYRRPGSFETPGPLVIESRVDRFEDAEQAAKAFDDLRTNVRGDDATELDPPAIGEEAVAVRIRQAGLRQVDFFTIAWRHANVTASITVNGFARKISFGQAVKLARKQERRIADAAES